MTHTEENELPEETQDLSVPTLTELGIDPAKIFSEMETLSVSVNLKIEPDILYINEKMVAVREATRRAQSIYIRIQQAAHIAESKLLEFETNYDILTNSTLENDDDVSRGQSSTERVAAAGNKHIPYKRAIKSAKSVVNTLKKLEKAVVLCQRNLRSINDDIKSQTKLMEAMLRNLNMGGDINSRRENPLFKEATKELDELDALADSILAQEGSDDTAEVSIESEETEGSESTEESEESSDLDATDPDKLAESQGIDPSEKGPCTDELHASGAEASESSEESASEEFSVSDDIAFVKATGDEALRRLSEIDPDGESPLVEFHSTAAEAVDPDFDIEIDPGLTGAPAAAPVALTEEPLELAEEPAAPIAAPAVVPVVAPPPKEAEPVDTLVLYDDEDDVLGMLGKAPEDVSEVEEQVIPDLSEGETDFSGLDDLVALVDEKEAKPPKPTPAPVASISQTRAPVVEPTPSKVSQQPPPIAPAPVEKSQSAETVDDFLAKLGLL